MTYDPSNFIPCPDRPNHWIEVHRIIPEQRIDHGKGHVEIRPAIAVPTGVVIACKAGDTLEQAIEKINAEADL